MALGLADCFIAVSARKGGVALLSLESLSPSSKRTQRFVYTARMDRLSSPDDHHLISSPLELVGNRFDCDAVAFSGQPFHDRVQMA